MRDRLVEVRDVQRIVHNDDETPQFVVDPVRSAFGR